MNHPTKLEQEELIAAFRKRRALMSTGDAAQIRAYLLKLHGTDPKAREVYTQTSDQELLEAAEMLTNVTVSDTKFYSPATEWKITDSAATINIHQGSGEELSIILKKINGEWL